MNDLLLGRTMVARITNRGVAPRDAKGTYRVRPATSAHPGVGAAASGAPRGAGLRSARAARCRLRVRVSTGDTAPLVGASTGHRTSSGCIHLTCDIEQLARLTVVLTVLSQYPMIPVDSLLLSLELARNTGDNSERHHTGISHTELHTVQNTAVRCCTPLGITTDPATPDTP